MKIAVLLGGDSPERDVSLHSGENIIKALQSKGHDVYAFDPAMDTEQLVLKLPLNAQKKEKILKSSIFNGYYQNIQLLKLLNPDVVFNGLHGGKGENGVVQALLDTLGMAYTGSGFESCLLAMDKDVSKLLLMREKMPTPKFIRLRSIDDPISLSGLNFPLIVKPADGGSTIGLSLIDSETEMPKAVSRAFEYGSKVIVEEYIRGKEIAAGVLAGKALPLVHIVPKHDIYDYECKYTSGMSDYIVPADISTSITELIKQMARETYNLLNCKSYARIDFLVTSEGDAYILEANTLPGMTATSLFPKAAQAQGMDFESLIDYIVRDALKHSSHAKK